MQNHHFGCYFIHITNFTSLLHWLKCSTNYRKIAECLEWNEVIHNSSQHICIVSCSKMPWLEISYCINTKLLVILLYIYSYCLSLLCLVPTVSISATGECSFKCSKYKPVVGRQNFKMVSKISVSSLLMLYNPWDLGIWWISFPWLDFVRWRSWL